MDSNQESEILKIVEKLTTSGQKTLEEDLIKKLKKICKSSNDCVNYTYYVLMTQLRKEHSEIRYSVLLIMNELFTRSSCFRKLFETDIQEILELVVETNPDNPLPLPQIRARELKLKALEFMKAWTSQFGAKHVRLQLALNFLKQCKKVDFNDMEARSTVQRERLRQAQDRHDRIVEEKVARIKAEMQENQGEIYNTLTQIENCFRLLVPHPTEDLFSGQDFLEVEEPIKDDHNDDDVVMDDEESTDEQQNKLRQHGIYDMKKSITVELTDKSTVAVKANEDNQPIIDNLNDLHKEISTRFFPMVTKWLKVLSKGSNCTDSLKKAIDIKQSLQSAFEKYKEINVMPDNDDSDDDDLEEVKEKEGYEADVKRSSKPVETLCQPSCSKELTAIEKACMWKFKHSEDDVGDPTSAASTLKKRNTKSHGEAVSISSEEDKEIQEKTEKEKLLEKAPVLPYDIDLYHWEDKTPVVPEIVKFDSLHKFWESKDDEDKNEALKEVQIASLRTRRIDFSGKFEPVKYSCRAPLPSGKLCPRQDRYKCPFHGRIIKRDSVGNPIDANEASTSAASTSSVATVPEWQDPALLRDIEAATGINLKVPEKRGKGGKKGQPSKKKNGLTNINNKKLTVKEKLTKKILKRYKHYAKKLDDMERKRFNDKFGDQWNYY